MSQNLYVLDSDKVKLIRHIVNYKEINEVNKEVKEIVQVPSIVVDKETDEVHTELVDKEITSIVTEFVEVDKQAPFTSKDEKDSFVSNLEEGSYTVQDIDQSKNEWIEKITFDNYEEVDKALTLGEKDYLYPLNETILVTKAWIDRKLTEGMEYEGKHYTCTLEKQSILTTQLNLYLANKEANIENSVELYWNESGKENTVWDFNSLLALSNAIHDYVAPIIQKQQEAELAIRAATTADEIKAILEDFKEEL